MPDLAPFDLDLDRDADDRDADPYVAPSSAVPTSPLRPRASFVAAALATLATAPLPLLLLLTLKSPRDTLAYSPQWGLALVMLAIGLWRVARRERGQGACYALAAVSIATLFGDYSHGVLEVCAGGCAMAALIAARGATALPRMNAGSGLPALVAALFGASGVALASLFSLAPIEAPLAAALGASEYAMPALLLPVYGFGAAATTALMSAGLLRGRWPWQCLAFVLGGIAYDAVGGVQADYFLPGVYAPYELKLALPRFVPFALGAVVVLAWRHRARVAK